MQRQPAGNSSDIVTASAMYGYDCRALGKDDCTADKRKHSTNMCLLVQ